MTLLLYGNVHLLSLTCSVYHQLGVPNLLCLVPSTPTQLSSLPLKSLDYLTPSHLSMRFAS